MPPWATKLYQAAANLHGYLVTEPKHEALRIIHDDLGAALKEWDAAIAAETAKEAAPGEQGIAGQQTGA